jgi:hypothetical protein
VETAVRRRLLDTAHLPAAGSGPDPGFGGPCGRRDTALPLRPSPRFSFPERRSMLAPSPWSGRAMSLWASKYGHTRSIPPPRKADRPMHGCVSSVSKFSSSTTTSEGPRSARGEPAARREIVDEGIPLFRLGRAATPRAPCVQALHGLCLRLARGGVRMGESVGVRPTRWSAERDVGSRRKMSRYVSSAVGPGRA